MYALLLIVLILPTSNAETITMATTDWQPFQGEDLPQYGFTVAIAQQALERKGHTMTIDFLPWARAMRAVKEGKYHGLFNPWKNVDIEHDYYFSQEILAHGDGHFLAMPTNEKHGLSPEDLKGQVVGFVRGYPVSDELIALFESGAATKREVTTVTQLIKLLKFGRIDVILENYLVAQHHFKSEWPDQTFDLKVIGKDSVDGSLYIGWSKQKTDFKTLRDDFDDAIREMRKDGTIEKIRQQFGIDETNIHSASSH